MLYRFCVKQRRAVQVGRFGRAAEGALQVLTGSIVCCNGEPVGTSRGPGLQRFRVSVREFVPSALVFLLDGRPEIVRNFLVSSIQMQTCEVDVGGVQLAEGVMPPNFLVCGIPESVDGQLPAKEAPQPEFPAGKNSSGMVAAPLDAGLWWIILFRAYVKCTGDTSIVEITECKKGMKAIFGLCSAEGFHNFPTLLCQDACCMVDTRMGIHGFPLEIQALFHMAMKYALPYLADEEEGKNLKVRIVKRLNALKDHICDHYWFDSRELHIIRRNKSPDTDEYRQTSVYKFDVPTESIPAWVHNFLPFYGGGYFVGNVGPSRMDFRWFAVGNLMAILSSLARKDQSVAIMDIIEAKWIELVGDMPLRICYPPLEEYEWLALAGGDPKNMAWRYHNGGSWPVLLWMLTAACLKTGRPQLAIKALELAQRRLIQDKWPRHYDGTPLLETRVGKGAGTFQTWTIAGYVLSSMFINDPTRLGIICSDLDDLIDVPETTEEYDEIVSLSLAL